MCVAPLPHWLSPSNLQAAARVDVPEARGLVATGRQRMRALHVKADLPSLALAEQPRTMAVCGNCSNRQLVRKKHISNPPA